MAKIYVYDSSRYNNSHSRQTWILEIDECFRSDKTGFFDAQNGWRISYLDHRIYTFDKVYRDKRSDKNTLTIGANKSWLRLSYTEVEELDCALKEMSDRVQQQQQSSSTSSACQSFSSILSRWRGKDEKENDSLSKEMTTTAIKTPAAPVALQFLKRVNNAPWTPFTLELDNSLLEYLSFIKSKCFNGIQFIYSVEDNWKSFVAMDALHLSSDVSPLDIFFAPYDYIERLAKAFDLAMKHKKDKEEMDRRNSKEYKFQQLGNPVHVFTTKD